MSRRVESRSSAVCRCPASPSFSPRMSWSYFRVGGEAVVLELVAEQQADLVARARGRGGGLRRLRARLRCSGGKGRTARQQQGPGRRGAQQVLFHFKSRYRH